MWIVRYAEGILSWFLAPGWGGGEGGGQGRMRGYRWRDMRNDGERYDVGECNKRYIPGTDDDCLFVFPLAIGDRPLSSTAP